MTRWNPILASLAALWLGAGALSAATPPRAGGPADPASLEEAARQSREEELYERARNDIDAEQWQRAIAQFDRVIEMSGTKADTAMYWKAYAQTKLGQNADALATLAALNKRFPQSKTLEQARALEMDVRRAGGQAVRPENLEDEDLKLYALQALGNQDPDQAIPMLEKILRGASSTKLKERALFVLAQMSEPRARKVLADAAKDDAHPELQSKAIQYLGVHGGRENRALLSDVYQSTKDVRVKKRVLQAWMVSGEQDRILAAATTEKDPELRSAAVQQLGVMGAQDELSNLYASENDKEIKKKILQAMFIGGRSERLVELARTESDPELRRAAVRNLGLMGAGTTGQALVAIYSSDKDPAVRKAVVDGLFIQNNADALVALARKETDRDMKRVIVEKLSLMRSKAATDYLMELLK